MPTPRANSVVTDPLAIYHLSEGDNLNIIGGTDVTNVTLIAWLEENAIQQTEPSSDVIETTISIGTSLLTDASVGTTKLLKAYIGNHLIFERLGSNFLTSDHNLLITSNGDIFSVQEAVTIISFTIAGTTYQAEEGMTWADWVDSSYNTSQYGNYDNYIYNHPGTQFVVYPDGNIPVFPNDTIYANVVYKLLGGGN